MTAPIRTFSQEELLAKANAFELMPEYTDTVLMLRFAASLVAREAGTEFQLFALRESCRLADVEIASLTARIAAVEQLPEQWEIATSVHIGDLDVLLSVESRYAMKRCASQLRAALAAPPQTGASTTKEPT